MTEELHAGKGLSWSIDVLHKNQWRYKHDTNQWRYKQMNDTK